MVGGAFASAGGAVANNVARWDGSAWFSLGAGVNGTDGVRTLFEFRKALYAGGYFTAAGGQAAANVSRWDGRAWSPLGTGTDGGVLALAVFQDHLIVGGTFFTAGGLPFAFSIARWDGWAWSYMGALCGECSVESLVVHDGQLYVGMNTGTGAPVRRWNGMEWTAVAPSLGWNTARLGTYRGELVASGFPMGAGQAGLARWDGAAWWALGGPINGPVYSLMAHEDVLHVGGFFQTAGGVPSPYWARWGCPCYPDCNNSASLTAADFGCFQTQFVLAHPYADCNHDGALTVQDFGCFQTKFVAGCP